MKLAAAGVMALIAWWASRRSSSPARVSRELEVDVNVNSPYFGMTDEEIAAAKAAGVRPNPAVDPDMRRLIDLSNAVIAADDASS